MAIVVVSLVRKCQCQHSVVCTENAHFFLLFNEWPQGGDTRHGVDAKGLSCVREIANNP